MFDYDVFIQLDYSSFIFDKILKVANTDYYVTFVLFSIVVYYKVLFF